MLARHLRPCRTAEGLMLCCAAHQGGKCMSCWHEHADSVQAARWEPHLSLAACAFFRSLSSWRDAFSSSVSLPLRLGLHKGSARHSHYCASLLQEERLAD